MRTGNILEYDHVSLCVYVIKDFSACTGGQCENRQTFILVPALPVISCVTLGNVYLTFLSFLFFTCKKGIIMFASQSCYEN